MFSAIYIIGGQLEMLNETLNSVERAVDEG